MREARTVRLATRALEAAGIPYALIGAMALSAHGVARTTQDADLLVATSRALRDEIWPRGGVPRAEIRRGDADDPLVGVVRIGARSSLPLDIVVPRGAWLQAVVERAIRSGPRVRLGGVEVPVVTLEDLVLLKVDAGGFIDRQDVHLLFEAWPERVPAIVEHVERHLPEMSAWARDVWQRLRAERA